MTTTSSPKTTAASPAPVVPPPAPTKGKLTLGAAQFAERLQRQVRSRKVFPPGHTVGIAYAKLFGPKNHTTPSGHPIQICSGPFDNTLQTAQQAIALAAKKRFGYEVHLAHWELELAEDVQITNTHPKPVYTKLYHFKYTPEQYKWVDRKLDDTVVPNHFKTSWYISHNHAKPGYKLDPSLGTTLISVAEVKA